MTFRIDCIHPTCSGYCERAKTEMQPYQTTVRELQDLAQHALRVDDLQEVTEVTRKKEKDGNREKNIVDVATQLARLTDYHESHFCI